MYVQVLRIAGSFNFNKLLAKYLLLKYLHVQSRAIET